MVEYILLVALIALAVIGAVTFLERQSNSKFQDAGNKIAAAGTDAGPCGTDTMNYTAADSITGDITVACSKPDGSHYFLIAPAH